MKKENTTDGNKPVLPGNKPDFQGNSEDLPEGRAEAADKEAEPAGHGGEQPAKKGRNRDQRISEYIDAQIPKGAVIDFIFYEDFNADGVNEAAIGFTRFTPFPPDSAILLMQKSNGKMEHSWLTAAESAPAPESFAVFDNAYASDTDGDGWPELVVSMAYGQEHCISVSVFDWADDGMRMVWRSPKSFFHGSMEVADMDGDGAEEIIVESGTNAGFEIIQMKDSCYRVRESCVYRWDGSTYTRSDCRVRAPYESFNIAVSFIQALWSRNYPKAYEMVVMPGFLGLPGLDDSSLGAFKSHVARKIRPALVKNLAKGKLIPSEPYDTCCQFVGAEDYFTVELVKEAGRMMVYSFEITKKNSYE